MLHAVSVKPFRLRDHSDLLEVDTSRIVGYVAHCKCGWRGKVCARHGDARMEGRGHAGSMGGTLQVM